VSLYFCFFHDTACTVIYSLSLHDALPIYLFVFKAPRNRATKLVTYLADVIVNGNPDVKKIDPTKTFVKPIVPKFEANGDYPEGRSEEHTSELQSRENLVCRLLLEKKKQII